MKLIKLVITILLALIVFPCFSQTVVVQNIIKMPADSGIKNALIASLNGFLREKERPNRRNEYVLNEDLPATSALLDEIKGMDKGAKDKSFFKCYLTNVTKVKSDTYQVQFSYLGLADSTPVLRSSFRLLAKRRGDKFYFSSPLKDNTYGWKSKVIDNVTFLYKDTLNIAEATAYQTAVDFDDKLLNVPKQPVTFYYCANFSEVQRLLGVDFKLDYNGIQYNALSAYENGGTLMVNGRSSAKQRFNAHDLWHERLHHVVRVDTINRPVDEGCAYLFGGSWEYTWPEVLAKFKKYAADHPNADWLNLYTTSAMFEDGSSPMYICYALNALIVQKINSEHGFAPVILLISCGRRKTGDENYFAELKLVTGIDKADFNAKMWELIKAAK